MAFNNTSPLSYATGQVVKYINAMRGVSDDVGGPKLNVIGLYSPGSGDLYDPSPTSNTANVYSVATTSNSAIIVSANSSIRGAVIVNESANTLYIAYANSASPTAYSYAIPALAVWEAPPRVWTGNISGFLGSGAGAARVTVLFA
jgi:hypothetical protein